jgi:secreted trypsin-like serine protease
MSLKVFAVLSLIALGSAQTTVNIPLNDPETGSFNVQIRHYDQPFELGSSQFKCIGSVISLKCVLTAASCVIEKQASEVVIVVGSTTLDWNNDNGEVQLIEKIAVHPNYNKEQPLVANLAILFVSSHIFH